MTHEQKRLALARKAGWTSASGPLGDGGKVPWTIWKKDGEHHHECPDYLSDLNAVAELEGLLMAEERMEYREILGRMFDCAMWAIHATALQRCDALIAVWGLDKEETK